MPTLRDSSSASSLRFATIASASACSRRERSFGGVLPQGPSSAARAASTARSTSASPAIAARPSASPVAGSTTSRDSPEAASTGSPSMKSPCSLPVATATSRTISVDRRPMLCAQWDPRSGPGVCRCRRIGQVSDPRGDARGDRHGEHDRRRSGADPGPGPARRSSSASTASRRSRSRSSAIMVPYGDDEPEKGDEILALRRGRRHGLGAQCPDQARGRDLHPPARRLTAAQRSNSAACPWPTPTHSVARP